MFQNLIKIVVVCCFFCAACNQPPDRVLYIHDDQIMYDAIKSLHETSRSTKDLMERDAFQETLSYSFLGYLDLTSDSIHISCQMMGSAKYDVISREYPKSDLGIEITVEGNELILVSVGGFPFYFRKSSDQKSDRAIFDQIREEALGGK